MSKRLSIVILLLSAANAAHADVKLPPVFGDGMVLQQGMKVPIWGTADAAELVTVTFQGQKVFANADAQGAWRVDLAPLAVGGPWPMTVAGKNTINFNAVYVGDVWVCSGQSNMEYPVVGTTGWADAAKEVTPTLRLSTGAGPWQPAAGDALLHFSGPGYYFGKALSDARHIPIGLISAAVGATVIEEWVPPDSLKPLGLPGGGDMYNAHIQPLLPFAIKGVLWYQGEFNVGRDRIYNQELHTLISTWRTAWGEPDLAFLIVQLPRNGEAPGPLDPPNPLNDWALLRAAQQDALDVPHTGMALFYDVTNGIIHPPDKRPIGEHLALLARSLVYGEGPSWLFRSPMLQKAVRRGDQLSLQFSSAETGMVASDTGAAAGATPGGAVHDLFLETDDGQVLPAKATIKGDSVVIDLHGIRGLPDVYYAWRGYPVGNLYNMSGLPAAPFRLESLHLRPSECAGNVLTLTSNQPLDPAVAGNIATYRLTGGTLTGAEVLPDRMGVRLTAATPWILGQQVTIGFPRWKGWDGRTPLPPITFTVLPGHYANNQLLGETLFGGVQIPVDPKTILQADVPDVKTLQPSAGDNWKLIKADPNNGGRFLLNGLVTVPAKQTAAALAHWYVYSDADRTVQLWAEGSTPEKLYMNGAAVGTWTPIPGPGAYEHIFPNVQLHKGWNSLLMEVISGGWSPFAVRIMNEHGAPSEGVSYQAVKPE